jgi:hypothetical protein
MHDVQAELALATRLALAFGLAGGGEIAAPRAGGGTRTVFHAPNVRESALATLSRTAQKARAVVAKCISWAASVGYRAQLS